MARVDWHLGRFRADNETDRMFQGMRGWRDTFGDWLDYYRFNEAKSDIDPVYDEVGPNGFFYDGPIRVPTLHVVHSRGENENGPIGFYFNDAIESYIPFDLFVGVGMQLVDIETGNFLKDRCIYRRKVFRITSLQIRGQIQQRPTIVTLSATQLKPDELIDSPQFAKYSETYLNKDFQ